MKTVAKRIIDLINEKKEEINRHKYFTLVIKVHDGYPTILKKEISLKPDKNI